MATSAATIVIGLLTASAFGLAAKDTVSKKVFLTPEQEAAAEDARHEAAMQKQQEEWEAQTAKEDAERVAVAAQKQATVLAYLPALFGDAIGPGVAFDGVTMGVNDSMTADARKAKVATFEAAAEKAGLVTFAYVSELGDQVLRTVTIPDSDGATTECDWVTDRLSAWGDAASVRRSDVWFDPATHQRVGYDAKDVGCDLTFDSALTASEWVDRAVPATLLHKSPDAARKVLAAERTIDGLDDTTDETWTWSVAGLEAGVGRTFITAIFEHGTITSLTATVDAGSAAVTNLQDALITKLGEATQDPYEGYVWTRPVPRHLTTDGDHVQFTVGE